MMISETAYDKEEEVYHDAEEGQSPTANNDSGEPMEPLVIEESQTERKEEANPTSTQPEDAKRCAEGLPLSCQEDFWISERLLTQEEKESRAPSGNCFDPESIEVWEYDSRNKETTESPYDPNPSLGERVSLHVGPITELKTDAYVLCPSGPTSNLIHEKAGLKLQREISRLKDDRCVKITRGYNLHANYIVYINDQQMMNAPHCYKTILEEATKYKIQSIAISSISDSVVEALSSTREFLTEHPDSSIQLVVFCTTSPHREKTYKNMLPMFFPKSPASPSLTVPIRKKDLRIQLANSDAQIEKLEAARREVVDHMNELGEEKKENMQEEQQVKLSLLKLQRRGDDISARTSVKLKELRKLEEKIKSEKLKNDELKRSDEKERIKEAQLKEFVDQGINNLDEHQLLELFRHVGIDQNTIQKLSEQEFNGAGFSKLTEKNIKKLNLSLTGRKRVSHLLKKIQENRLGKVELDREEEDWDCDRVKKWMEDNNFKPEIISKLDELDGVSLLLLNEKDLEGLDIKMGEIMNILPKLDKLQMRSCRSKIEASEEDFSKRHSEFADELERVKEQVEQMVSHLGEKKEIPEDYVCPITKEIMFDPVVDCAGHTYEKAAIQEWFARGKKTSPKTGEELGNFNLIPNYSIKSAIQSFLSNANKQE